jgi:hypothetical protein
MYYMALGGVFAHIGRAGTGITWRRKYLERDVSISVMLGLLLMRIHHASPTFSHNISIYATQLSGSFSDHSCCDMCVGKL